MLRITLVFFALIMCAAFVFAQPDGFTSDGISDPIFTGKMLEDLPFIKPEITLQRALVLAEISLKKKIDLRPYFLQEAKLSYSQKNGIRPCWYFKWAKWGVKQPANEPLEVNVLMDGSVSLVPLKAK